MWNALRKNYFWLHPKCDLTEISSFLHVRERFIFSDIFYSRLLFFVDPLLGSRETLRGPVCFAYTFCEQTVRQKVDSERQTYDLISTLKMWKFGIGLHENHLLFVTVGAGILRSCFFKTKRQLMHVVIRYVEFAEWRPFGEHVTHKLFLTTSQNVTYQKYLVFTCPWEARS